MTSQKLYEILSFFEKLDTRLSLQRNLEAVATALKNIVSNPAAPQHQSTLASALASFEAAAKQLRGSITPSQAAAIAEMGGREFFDPSIAERVMLSVQTNAMTPSVAQAFVQDLADRRSAFLSTVRSALENLGQLGISGRG